MVANETCEAWSTSYSSDENTTLSAGLRACGIASYGAYIQAEKKQQKQVFELYYL